MPRHVRELDAAVVATPSVPVTAAQPGRLDRDDDAPGRRCRVWHLAQLGKLTEPVVDHGAHEPIVTQKRVHAELVLCRRLDVRWAVRNRSLDAPARL